MSSNGLMYALKHAGTKIQLVTSAELVAKFPEALVSFLENQVVFNWPQRQTPFNNVLNNRIYISACTNQGPQGIKYLFSRNNVQFLRVIRSKFAVERSHAVPDNKVFGDFSF